MAAGGLALAVAELSAGILLYRVRGGRLEVMLIHPGGPYWRSKDAGAWMIPKGGLEPGESAMDAALREFEEELGTKAEGTPQPLGAIRQKGGKTVEAFALEGSFDVATLASVDFELEWPPRSGRTQLFPEADRAEWFDFAAAGRKMLPSQLPLLERLAALVGADPATGALRV